MHESTISRSGVALAALLALSGCGGSEAQSGDTNVDHVSVAAVPGSPFLPLFVGEEAGYFHDRDIEVDVVNTQGTGPAVSALASGDVDVVMLSVSGIASANGEGAKLRAFCGIGDRVENLVSLPDSPLPSATAEDWQEAVRQWEGTTIGMPTLGGDAEMTLDLVIRAAGGDPAKVDYVAVGGGEGALTTLEQGNIDLMWTYPFDLQSFGDAVRIVYAGSTDGPEAMQQESTAFWVAEKEWLDANPALATAYCHGMGEILDQVREREWDDEVHTVLTKTFGVSGETTRRVMAEEPLFNWLGNELSCVNLQASLDAWKHLNDDTATECEDVLWTAP